MVKPRNRSREEKFLHTLADMWLQQRKQEEEVRDGKEQKDKRTMQDEDENKSVLPTSNVFCLPYCSTPNMFPRNVTLFPSYTGLQHRKP
jgi:hypothetical protein